jgi:hypothetical protein
MASDMCKKAEADLVIQQTPVRFGLVVTNIEVGCTWMRLSSGLKFLKLTFIDSRVRYVSHWRGAEGATAKGEGIVITFNVKVIDQPETASRNAKCNLSAEFEREYFPPMHVYVLTVVRSIPRPTLTSNFSLSACLFTGASPLPPRRDWKIGTFPAPPSLIDNNEPIDLTEDIADKNSTPRHQPPSRRRTPKEYSAHRASLKKAFPEGWSPPRKISREAMDGLRELHAFDPELFTTPVLADKFRISPEAVRRILKSKWVPTREQLTRYAERERQNKKRNVVASRLEEIRRSGQYEDGVRREQSSRPDDHRGRRVRGVNPRDGLYFS